MLSFESFTRIEKGCALAADGEIHYKTFEV